MNKLKPKWGRVDDTILKSLLQDINFDSSKSSAHILNSQEKHRCVCTQRTETALLSIQIIWALSQINKPVFVVSNKAGLQPVSSATETS